MKPASHTDDKRPVLFVGNRWINTIYTGYGVIKQRILLQILEELQMEIKKVMNGSRLQLPSVPFMALNLDMSKIIHFNNYYQVRKAVREMSTQRVKIYNDPTFKQQIYLEAPLLIGYEPTAERRTISLHIKREIVELLLRVDFKNNKAAQYTKFDPFTITHIAHGVCKYRMPLYLMICSYANKGGFTIDIDQLRQRLQVEEKYKGFDNFHRFILKHVQKELQLFGAYGFNFTLVKTGKSVKQVVFKIFANTKYDPNHVWLRLQRALHQELPYFMRFTEEQHEQFNYLLTGQHDLDEVLKKFQHIHKALVKRKLQNDPVKSAYHYTIRAIHEQFPPG